MIVRQKGRYTASEPSPRNGMMAGKGPTPPFTILAIANGAMITCLRHKFWIAAEIAGWPDLVNNELCELIGEIWK